MLETLPECFGWVFWPEKRGNMSNVDVVFLQVPTGTCICAYILYPRICVLLISNKK